VLGGDLNLQRNGEVAFSLPLIQNGEQQPIPPKNLIVVPPKRPMIQKENILQNVPHTTGKFISILLIKIVIQTSQQSTFKRQKASAPLPTTNQGKSLV
jgi:hypothetical protein